MGFTDCEFNLCIYDLRRRKTSVVGLDDDISAVWTGRSTVFILDRATAHSSFETISVML